MTVYIDILIFLNTLVNYFMLLAVKRISRANSSRARIALGALAGGLASLLIFAERLGVLMTLLKALTSVIMVLIAFKFTDFRAFLKNTLWLFVIGFIFGGLMLAAYLFLDLDIMLYTNGIVYFDIDMSFLVICSVVAYGVISLITYLLDKKAPKSREYYATVQSGAATVSCTALMDTGNNLREPFSGFPVITVDKQLFSQLFGGREGKGLRLIPVTTVGGAAVLPAYRPDSVIIGGRTVKNVYIAESSTPLSEYRVILNVNLEEEISCEKAEAVVK